MIIKPPIAASRQAQDLATLPHTPGGMALLAFLTDSRAAVLEMLAQVPDEARLRQLQGAATVLKELHSTINRTP